MSLTGCSFHVRFPTSTKLLFLGGFNDNVFMSTCFVLNLSCLRAGLCGARWVWEGNFYWICRPLIWHFTEHVRFLWVFFMHFSEAGYLSGFCVDRCPGRKGLIVTWRHILNCNMTSESMYMGERGRAYTYLWAYMCARGHACLCACGCLHDHMGTCTHASKQFLIA